MNQFPLLLRSVFLLKLLLVALFLFSGCAHAQKQGHVLSFVDPFIGTGGHGHTYPGASAPFGMIQVSPDTRLDGWDGCSGYHASDHIIYGFSHTHLSGTGCLDYGDILLMPVCGDVSLEAYAYASPFQVSSEKSSPGYYRVNLDNHGIGVELTATKRSGLHKYTYPVTDLPAIVLDLVHRDKVLDAGMAISGKTEIEGYRFSSAWAKEQRLYFVIRFSEPFSACIIDSASHSGNPLMQLNEKHLRAHISFPSMKHGGEVLVKVGISAVSIEGARKNLDAEIPSWNFEQVLANTQEDWRQELGKIVIEGGTTEQRTVFYTALYHAMLSPDLYTDVDGQYLGRDLQPHQASGFDYYTVFSLWDTYRALHPLLTILDQKRTSDFINTFIRQYEEGGLLPVWELSANETNCMIGYHAIPVIADAYLKGIRGFDAEKALEAMKVSAMQDQFGLKWYRGFGFIPGDKEGESVSRTLEYAYDDWCIAQMAQAMGKTNDYREYIQRAQSYKHLWDPSTRFFRAKTNNQWITPFDPYEVNFHYTEANAWQYSLYVPQDIPGLIALMGGPQAFGNRLDTLFAAQTQTTGRNQADITGLIGQYAHGNEPSHHMAYLYDYIGQPWKTQELVHQITSTLYSKERDGLSGNEDCGQMSAWYVFSALGFYPVTPAGGWYAIGTPLFPAATIRLENGNSFTIRAKNLSQDNYYIQSCAFNGRVYNSPFISHEDLTKGGDLIFTMGNEPNTDWGVTGGEAGSGITDWLIQPAPFIASGDAAFFDSTVITLSSMDPEARIYYRLTDPGSEMEEMNPEITEAFFVYEGPIRLDKSTLIRFYAQKEGGASGKVLQSDFKKIPKHRNIKLNTKYAPQYAAGGDIALIDGKTGEENFKTGIWQGYEGVDLDAVVDLGSSQEVRQISVGFLQDAGAWIFFPVEVRFFTSDDGITYTPAGISIHEVSRKDFTARTLQLWTEMDPPVRTRYIRIIATNPGICPDWHPGAGNPGWIFADEITIE